MIRVVKKKPKSWGATNGRLKSRGVVKLNEVRF